MKKKMNIKNIAKLDRVDMYKKKEDRIYVNDKGIILVEFEDNSRRILDLASQLDITDYNDWEVMIYNNNKMDYLFKGKNEYYS